VASAARRLSIGQVAERAGMSASRIRYYEARGLIDPPERSSGKRRYGQPVLRRLAIIDAAQRVGFSLQEISDLLGSRDAPAHERLRRLALRKLPEIDALLLRAATVRQLLQYCGDCTCSSIDECRLLDERTLSSEHSHLSQNPPPTSGSTPDTDRLPTKLSRLPSPQQPAHPPSSSRSKQPPA
jgi:MerR family transcriptional regulator, redox-sensitive transcriptional activator SoxR